VKDEFKMTGGPRELTREERESLARLRGVVLSYHRAGLETGRALREIRDRKLWREDAETWDDYCARFLSMSRQRANQLIKFADVVDEMSETGVSVPVNERQARPLGKLSDEERAEVAARVNDETFGRGFEGVRGTRIEEIADEVTGVTGAEVIPLRRDLVEVRERDGTLAVVTLSESGFLRLLDRFDAHARRMARLLGGPAATEKAIAAIPERDAAARIEQIDRICRVAGWLFVARLKRWPRGPAYGQESWAFAEDWDWARAARETSSRFASAADQVLDAGGS